MHWHPTSIQCSWWLSDQTSINTVMNIRGWGCLRAYWPKFIFEEVKKFQVKLNFLGVLLFNYCKLKKYAQGYRQVNIFDFFNSWRTNTKSKLTERMGFGKHLFEHEHSVVVQLVVLFVWISCTLVLDALVELTVSLLPGRPSLVFGEILFFLGAQCGGFWVFNITRFIFIGNLGFMSFISMRNIA